MDKQLEAMMTSQECFWPDDQIISQSICDGQEGPFAKHGKALSSVFVKVCQLIDTFIKLLVLPQVGDQYGTRTTTTVVVGQAGDVRFREKEWISGLATEITFTVQ